MNSKVKDSNSKTIARNKRAYYDYEIIEKIEAGIMLLGTEVKTLRHSNVKLGDSYATINKQGLLEIHNLKIPVYHNSSTKFNHEPSRIKKLLVHKRQLNKIDSLIRLKGMSIIATSIYFNEKGICKVNLGIGKGKRKIDKRQTIKDREWKINKASLLKKYNQN